MEKIIYLVRRNDTVSGDEFRRQALAEISEKLLALDNVKKLRICVEDSDVTPAANLKIEKIAPICQAMLSVWVDTANSQNQLVAVLQPYTSRIEGYLVTESEVMAPPSRESERTVGMNQLVTFSHLPSLSRGEFLTIWRDSHGPLACEVQSTFGFRQHLIARKLTPDAQDHSAIVEEHFPAAAMDSPNAFYDAVGDDEKLQKHVKMMIASCTRFIDFDSINTVHMSEYTIRA